MTLGNSAIAENTLAELGGENAPNPGGEGPGGGGGGRPVSGGAWGKDKIKPTPSRPGKPAKDGMRKLILDDFQQYWNEIQDKQARAAQERALRARKAQEKAAHRQALKDVEAGRRAAKERERLEAADKAIADLQAKLAAKLAAKQQKKAIAQRAELTRQQKAKEAAVAAQKQAEERATKEAVAAAAKAERDALLEQIRRRVASATQQDKKERDVTLRKLMKELERAQNEYEAVALLLS